MSALDYYGIKTLAAELCRPTSTLIALAAQNDPFYIGPARAAEAKWFADIWHQLNIPLSSHYRRIHYVLISQDGTIVMLDGKPYENTLECWRALCDAARDAIALDIVPQNAFSDHRNAKPIIHLVDPEEASAAIINDNPKRFIPAIPPLPEFAFLRPIVPQPYHVEVWCEKSTINDILAPIASEYRLNLVTGIGELSATRCREFVDRAIRSGRPTRILYISDFDPAGASMPVAVARKIEFELYRRSLDLDVQVRPIALTHDQCVEYSLPRTPIKESERRAARFEARFGEGATELDALEALRPGAFRQIVVLEVEHYWNADHDIQVRRACHNTEQYLKEVTRAAHHQHWSEFQALKADWANIVAQINEWQARAEPIWQAITNRLQEDCPTDLEIECPEFAADEDPDPLYDSFRRYVEQIDRYKRHQGKPTARKAVARRLRVEE
jgi:hypothetical protein